MAGGGEGGGEYDVNINLTALLDVLTNLLFFLMFGYAAQQVSMEVNACVRLPSSNAELAPKKSLKIVVGISELRIENEVVAPLKDGKVVLAGDIPDKRIEPLYVGLVRLREDKVVTSSDAPDALYVLCDKEAPYSLLRRVLNTAAEAGFPKFRLAAIMR